MMIDQSSANSSLGGGGTSSLHLDTRAKTYAQQILAVPVSIPRSAAEKFKI